MFGWKIHNIPILPCSWDFACFSHMLISFLITWLGICCENPYSRFCKFRDCCTIKSLNYKTPPDYAILLEKFKAPVHYYNTLFTFTNFSFLKKILLKRNWWHKSKQKTFFSNNIWIYLCELEVIRKISQKTNISYTLKRIPTCAYQEVRYISFTQDVVYVLNV